MGQRSHPFLVEPFQRLPPMSGAPQVRVVQLHEHFAIGGQRFRRRRRKRLADEPAQPFQQRRAALDRSP